MRGGVAVFGLDVLHRRGFPPFGYSFIADIWKNCRSVLACRRCCQFRMPLRSTDGGAAGKAGNTFVTTPPHTGYHYAPVLTACRFTVAFPAVAMAAVRVLLPPVFITGSDSTGSIHATCHRCRTWFRSLPTGPVVPRSRLLFVQFGSCVR